MTRLLFALVLSLVASAQALSQSTTTFGNYVSGLSPIAQPPRVTDRIVTVRGTTVGYLPGNSLLTPGYNDRLTINGVSCLLAASCTAGITALTGDLLASGNGSVGATLANTTTARSNIGLGTASTPQFTGTLLSGTLGSTTTQTQQLAAFGSYTGTVTSGGSFFNEIAINNDTVDSSIPGGSTAFFVGENMNSAFIKGGRTTLGTFLNITNATGNGAGNHNYYVALGPGAQASANDGGTNVTGAGNLFGFNPAARLLSGATYWQSVVGGEVDVRAEAGTTKVYSKEGFKVVQEATDAVQGTVQDYGYGLVNQTGAVGWLTGFTFGSPDGEWPLSATGTTTMIGTLPGAGGSRAYTATHGIDFSAVTFSTDAFKSTGFSVSPTGKVFGTGVGSLTSGAFGGQITFGTSNGDVLTGGPGGSTLDINQANYTTLGVNGGTTINWEINKNTKASLTTGGLNLTAGGSLTMNGLFRDLQTSDTGWTLFGAPEAVVASHGAVNNFVGYAYNDLAPNTNALPVGTIGYGKLPVASTGNQVFGLYGLGEIYAPNGSVIAAEVTVRNNSGNPGSSAAPDDCSIGTASVCAHGLNVTAGGSDQASIGINISPEGGSSVGFNTPLFIKGSNNYNYGIYVENTASGTPYAALLKGNPTATNLQLQTVGTQQPNNSVLTVINDTTTYASIRQNGDFYGSSYRINGSSSGTLKLTTAAAAGTNTLTFPAGSTDFTATGGASQVVKQTSAGGALTVGQLAASDLSNGTTGSGAAVLAGSPLLTTTGNTPLSINRSSISGGTNSFVNLTGDQVVYGQIATTYVTTTAAAEVGEIFFKTVNAGSMVEQLRLASGVEVGAPTGAGKGTGTINAAGAVYNNGSLVWSPTAPTIASGGCTTGSAQSISANNGTKAFELTLGGATCGNTITLTLPAAAHNWKCDGNVIGSLGDYVTTTGAASTTAVVLTNVVRTTGVAGNFAGASVYAVSCAAY